MKYQEYLVLSKTAIKENEMSTSINVVTSNKPNGVIGEALTKGFTMKEVESLMKQIAYRKAYNKKRYERMKVLKSIIVKS
jgi:ABC-type Zn2+ transport system substrate-binding protein/surface adhesin